MKQVVVYLKPSSSPLVRQTVFELSRTRHEFDVIRLWEQPTELFLSVPGLLPFAVLTQQGNPEQILRQVDQAAGRLERNRRSDVVASVSVLAGLVLGKDIIQKILRQDVMRESVIYQEILAEGEAKGEAKAEIRIALDMLRADVPLEQVAAFTRLPLEKVKRLQKELG